MAEFVTHKMALKDAGAFDVLQTELTDVQHRQATNSSQHSHCVLQADPPFFMAALCNRAGHYIFAVVSFLLSFLFFLA